MHFKAMRFTTLILALALLAPSAAAQKPPPTGEAMQIHPEAKYAIDRIKSPYCPGMMLEVCTSSGGAMLRDSIQAMAVAGLSGDSIVELILAEYGEEWRAEPKASGLGLWAWIIPPGILIAGLGMVGIVLARRRARLPDPSAFPEPDADTDARIRAALQEMDREEEPVF